VAARMIEASLSAKSFSSCVFGMSMVVNFYFML
jgi:hypothetical protein